MWNKIRVIFTIPELRQRLLWTLGFLAIYRVGWHITLPFVDPDKSLLGEGSGFGQLLDHVAIFSASQLRQATIFGLGIMPYISASIIFQLLASVWAPLERLKKEGESGQKKINEYTRYATVAICIVQSWFFVKALVGTPDTTLIHPDFQTNGGLSLGWQITAVMTMTAGTVFLMWLGEQIDEYGVGNGISLLIMAGILAQMPAAGWELIRPIVDSGNLQLTSSPGQIGVDKLLVLAVLFVSVVVGVVFIYQGQRRIPTQSAKHVRGRRVWGGGTRQYLPLRVNQAGVMPIIFASSLLMFPALIFQLLLSRWPQSDLLRTMFDSFQRGTSYTYNVLYVAMIYFFCYFWTAITFNPKDMANNLKDYGSFIPGYRPGKRTADYLEKVMVRITYVGAGFLALVAITPTVVAGLINVSGNVASFYGGTALLIAVSVAFDFVQKVDSHLVMRNYRGLLEG